MNQLSDEEAFDVLHRKGFTDSEIERLVRLRHNYAASTPRQVPHTLPLQRFARWLGRWCIRIMLTDEVWYELTHWSQAEKREG